MSTEYVVFPDRREDDVNFDEAMEITSGGLIEALPEYVISRLRRIDWAHPVLLVYREDQDNRWSQVLLGLNSPEGLGEGE